VYATMAETGRLLAPGVREDGHNPKPMAGASQTSWPKKRVEVVFPSTDLARISTSLGDSEVSSTSTGSSRVSIYW